MATPDHWHAIMTMMAFIAKYRFSVHNSGNPPYTTDDGKGGWGGDHGTPQTVCALKDGLLLAS